MTPLHPTSRGSWSLTGDKVYSRQREAVWSRLDAKTGKEVWPQQSMTTRTCYYMSLAP